ncbi:hypothetical protein [Pendulispora albinea]|uniref:Uncharacterized protein n=1 Tax=Pendulispora albinea TaxID=2741071 RepID=A0ABZ2M416_9BACT
MLASLSVFPGCGDDDKKSGADEPLTMRCGVRTVAGPAIDYTVSGDTLTLNVGGQIASIPRVAPGSGGKPIHGTWQLPNPEPTDNPASVERYQIVWTGTVRVEPGRATFAVNCSSTEHKMSVSASSPVTITDTQFRILEVHEEIKEWSAGAGESTVSKSSTGAPPDP